MQAKDYLAYIVREIHTTIVATVDDEGLPVTAAIDMMERNMSRCLPAELHRRQRHTVHDRAGALPALRQLLARLPGECDRKAGEIRDIAQNYYWRGNNHVWIPRFMHAKDYRLL